MENIKNRYAKPSMVVVLLILLAVGTYLISTSKSEVKSLVEEANSGCPYSIEGGKIISIKYEDESVIFKISNNDDDLDTLTYTACPDKLKDFYYYSFLADENKTDELNLIKLITNYKLGAKIINYNIQGKTYTTELSSDYIQMMKPNMDMPYREALRKITETECEINNHRYPIEIDPGILATDLKFEGNDIIMTYQFDDNMFDFSKIKADRENIRLDNILSFKENKDSQINKLLRRCCIAHINLIYRYTASTSDDMFEITYTHKEIEEILNE